MNNQKFRGTLVLILFLLSLIFAMTACDSKRNGKNNAARKTVVATLQQKTTALYYKGTLAPIKTLSILSPVDGSITKLYFKYGDSVKEGQALALINSNKLADDYRQAVTKYLQAKDTYATSVQSFQGTEALHKAGVISTDEYRNNRSQYETNILNFYQAKFELEKILTQANIDPATVEKLSIVDTKAVNEILQRKFSHIMIHAVGSGVALFPVGTDSGSSDSTKTGKLVEGSQVKEGQLILSIGDLSGFSATLQVSEININKVKVGQKAQVTGDAFPGMVLNGVVTSVASQANPDQGSGNSALSLFNIIVEIPKVTDQQRQIIHVGMTANIEIDIQNPPHILLPITAVTEKNGQSIVTVIDEKTGAEREVPVVTGDTTITDVTIIKGIKPGDRVVIHD